MVEVRKRKKALSTVLRFAIILQKCNFVQIYFFNN